MQPLYNTYSPLSSMWASILHYVMIISSIIMVARALQRETTLAEWKHSGPSSSLGVLSFSKSPWVNAWKALGEVYNTQPLYNTSKNAVKELKKKCLLFTSLHLILKEYTLYFYEIILIYYLLWQVQIQHKELLQCFVDVICIEL